MLSVVIKDLLLGDVYYQTERNLSTFSEADLINNDFSFCSQILLAIDL